DDRQALRRPGDDLASDDPDIRDFIREMKVVEDQRASLGGDRRYLRKKRLDDVLSGRAAGLERPEHRRGPRGEVGIVLPAGPHEMGEEAEPVPIVVIEPEL